MMKLSVSTIKHKPILFSIVLFAVSISHADDAFDLFRRAAKATQETAFQGTMEYKRKVFDEEWESKFTINHQPSKATKIVFISPDIVKGNVLIRTVEGLWVTPLSDENLGKVMKEMEPFPFYRFLDKKNALFFQSAVDFNHVDLLLKNYKIESGSENDRTFQIHIKPVYEYRPSLKCRFERETQMQRSCRHYNHENELDESFVFLDVTVNAVFTDQDFNLDTLKKIHSFESPDHKEIVKPDFKTIALKWIPRGFELIHTDTWNGRQGVTYHNMYSDGFARLSVFQRKLTDDERDKNRKDKKDKHDEVDCVVNRLKQRGEWVYFRDIDKMRITAVGDIAQKSIGKTLSEIKSD